MEWNHNKNGSKYFVHASVKCGKLLCQTQTYTQNIGVTQKKESII